jgi:hypothetical protein
MARLTARAALMGSFVVTVPFGVGCQKKIQPEECGVMLDRYIDMVVAADPATQNLAPEQAAAVRQMKKAVKKAEASYMQVQTKCASEVTRKEFDCAMAAKNADEWEACIE